MCEETQAEAHSDNLTTLTHHTTRAGSRMDIDTGEADTSMAVEMSLKASGKMGGCMAICG